MADYDLSILIPARSEQFISTTVKDILKNKRGKTEVIVGLDGEWASPEIEQHKDLRIVYVSESLGQRAMTNKLCKLIRAKYVAKTDAHCAFSEGFDLELMKTFEELGDNITVAPLMKNLHAFDWKCMKCGKRTYQGPTPTSCEDCDNTDNFTQKIVFKPRERTPNSYSYRFDTNLQFWYFGEYKEFQGGDLVESMSLQGSFFMLTREKYWQLNICDETWGSWGQQGTEVALKTWLSGGRVIVNKRCWYAHLFRTQAGFSFPYPQSGTGQHRARKISQNIFLKNKFEHQIHPLSWLLEKFWKGLEKTSNTDKHWHGWTKEKLAELKQYDSNVQQPTEKAMIYTTHNQLKLKVAHRVQRELLELSKTKATPIVSCTLRPVSKMGKNIVIKGERSVETMFRQIVTALENCKAEIVYFTEHDVLYHPSHFDLKPLSRDKFYYNQNWWRIREGSDVTVHWDANQISGLICYRELALEYFREKLAQVQAGKFDRSYEPGGRNGGERLWSEYPNIDIRGDWNQTKSKWSPDDFRDKSTCVNWQEKKVSEIEGWKGADILRIVNG